MRLQHLVRHDVFDYVLDFLKGGDGVTIYMLKLSCRYLYRVINIPITYCSIPAVVRNLNLLSWVLKYEAKFPSSNICPYAVYYGNLDVLQWYRDNFSDKYYDFGTCYLAMLAAKYGHLNIIKWLRRTGQKWCAREVAVSSAFTGNFSILRWLKKKRFYDYTKKITLFAGSRFMNFEIIEYINSRKAEITTLELSRTTERAVLGLNFALLLWLIDSNLVSAGEVYEYASEYRIIILINLLEELYF